MLTFSVKRFFTHPLNKYLTLLKNSQFLENYLPRSFENTSHMSNLVKNPTSDYDITTFNKGICEPSHNMLDRSGKM